MVVKRDQPEKSVEPPLEERELTLADVEAIERALHTKRPIGWVHAMVMARRFSELSELVVELQAENERLRDELADRCVAGRHRRGRGV